MFLQGRSTPKLGLDLAGGTTVTLTAKTEAGKNPPASQMDQAVKIITQRVNGLGVSDAEVNKQGSNNIVVSVPGEGQQQVVDTIGKTAKLQFRQVYVVGVGTPAAAPSVSPTGSVSPSTTPKATTTPKASESPKAGVKPSASSTPRSRALSEALAAPTPTPSGTGKSSPSATPSVNPSVVPSLPPDLGGQEDFTGIEDKAVIDQYKKLACSPNGTTAPGSNDPTKKWVAACDKDGKEKYILGPVRVEGTQVSDANAMPPDPQQGQSSWTVAIKFKSAGGRQFAAVTTDAYKAPAETPQRRVAIVLDGQVVSAPSIDNGPITGGTASIFGPPDSFTQTYADDLANVLKYGALPLEFTQSSIDEVSSTLGSDQLRGGLIAGAIGLALVVLYCMVYYQGLGLVAVSSLVVASAITYLSVVILGEGMGFRLSLPHIIGLIVSIGITADSFIVYFERLRDELRAGRTLRPSIESAWKRARRTILVADAVTFLAAVVLYFLAVGGVRGFAFAMGLTTLIDVVVVFFFTKPLVALLSRTRFFGKGHRLSGLSPSRLRRGGTTAPLPKSQEA
ncbi:protein translocase subunit SecD [Actinomadura rudentiformis]|uniref:Protein translocase subunit SecD n=2 Tax=Actinomadura rudentiformis TaxID=359158 RepID=A0A6H9Y8H2_9ACTN|nr:protein translocase subunit SecD [Actinomadura rudentiformis]